MNRYLTAWLVLTLAVTACGDKPPVDWMYAEYKSLFQICADGNRVPEKTSTASLTYTWSCPYPKDFQKWLSEFEDSHLTPRGWSAVKTKPPYQWKTYCTGYQNVVMRIVKVDAKKPDETDRLWISIRFPGNECPYVTNSSNEK